MQTELPNTKTQCAFLRALYGHPESGAIWDKKMHKVMKECGLLPVGEGSPGVFYNPSLGAEMMVYVDDFKMAGAPANLKKAWQGIMQHISFKEKPKPTTRCLGCNHIFKEITLPNGKKAKGASWEMSDSLKQAVQSYIAAGGKQSLPKVSTPFLNDSKAMRRQDEDDQPEGTLARSACSILM